MTKEQLEDYLNNYIKPTLEEYAKEKNISIEELLKQSIENHQQNITDKKKKTTKRH